jgi:hypothetical protein
VIPRLPFLGTRALRDVVALGCVPGHSLSWTSRRLRTLAPTIPMTVPIRSAVRSTKFAGSRKGGRGGGRSGRTGHAGEALLKMGAPCDDWGRSRLLVATLRDPGVNGLALDRAAYAGRILIDGMSALPSPQLCQLPVIIAPPSMSNKSTNFNQSAFLGKISCLGRCVADRSFIGANRRKRWGVSWRIIIGTTPPLEVACVVLCQNSI